MLKLSKQLLAQNSLMLRQLAALKSSGIRLQHRNYSNPSYEGDGKTNCKVLNNDIEMGLMVNSYSQVSIEKWFEYNSISVNVKLNGFLLLDWFSTQ